MTTTPHGQVPEALIDLIDAYAETRHRYGGIYNARTEAARKAVIEALSGVQALSAAPAIGDELRDTLVAVSAAIAERDDRAAQKMICEILAASTTPPAEQQAQPCAVYAELPEPDFGPGRYLGKATGDEYTKEQLRDFADRTHALRMQAAPKAAPTRTALPEGWTDCTIEFGNDGPEVVAYGPKRMMTRLAKWLGKYFAQVIADAATKAAPGEPSDYQIRAITTAYEQGVGKGHQAYISSKETANPYDSTYRCDLAWQYGYGEGKEQARRATKAAFQPAPAPLSEMPYEKRKAIQEGEQIGASDAWFKARHEMLDTLDRRNVFRAGFDRGWSAAIAAQGGKV